MKCWWFCCHSSGLVEMICTHQLVPAGWPGVVSESDPESATPAWPAPDTRHCWPQRGGHNHCCWGWFQHLQLTSQHIHCSSHQSFFTTISTEIKDEEGLLDDIHSLDMSSRLRFLLRLFLMTNTLPDSLPTSSSLEAPDCSLLLLWQAAITKNPRRMMSM